MNITESDNHNQGPGLTARIDDLVEFARVYEGLKELIKELPIRSRRKAEVLFHELGHQVVLNIPGPELYRRLLKVMPEHQAAIDRVAREDGWLEEY